MSAVCRVSDTIVIIIVTVTSATTDNRFLIQLFRTDNLDF